MAEPAIPQKAIEAAWDEFAFAQGRLTAEQAMGYALAAAIPHLFDDEAIERVRNVLIEATDEIPAGGEGYVGWSAVLAEQVTRAALNLTDPKETRDG